MGKYTEYTVAATATVEGHFRCRSCGYEDDARAEVASQARTRETGDGHSLTEQENHTNRTAERARENARTLGRIVLCLAPCPRCKTRDEEHVRAHTIRAIATTTLCAVAAVGLAYLAYRLFQSSEKVMLAAAFFAGICAIGSVVQAFRVPSEARLLYREAAEHVSFGPRPREPEPAEDPEAPATERKREKRKKPIDPDAPGARARARIAARTRSGD